MIGRIFRALGSLRLSLILFFLLSLNLLVGYFCLEGNTVIFFPLNEVGLMSWLGTYGLQNLSYTFWIYLLLPLLSLLAINTLVCTLIKLKGLAQKKGLRLGHFATRLSLLIHLIHLAVILMLAGYLVSYTLGETRQGLVLAPGKEVSLGEEGIMLRLDAMELIPYEADRIASFTDRNLNVAATVTVSGPGLVEKQLGLGINRPALVAGRLLLLERFNPKYQGGMSNAPYLVITVRKDYGGFISLAGMLAFSLGLMGYLYHRTPAIQRRRKP